MGTARADELFGSCTRHKRCIKNPNKMMYLVIIVLSALLLLGVEWIFRLGKRGRKILAVICARRKFQRNSAGTFKACGMTSTRILSDVP
jgi:hypothetical protein